MYITRDAFDERYKNPTKIGKGAFGTVYKAYDTERRLTVALKMFDTQGGIIKETSTVVKSFYREKNLLERLRNIPHVVDLYDAWIVSGKQYVLSVQYFAGESLNKSTFSAAHALQIAREGLKALQEIHQHGIVHGDIKAENILYAKESGSLLIDFGVSCVALDVQASRQKNSLKDDLHCQIKDVDKGTWQFFSLDRFRVADNERSVSLETYFQIMRKDDLFAFGIVLYEISMGHPYKSPHTFGTFLNEQEVHRLLTIPDSMYPKDFSLMKTKPLYDLAAKLLTASYTKRPTATAALSLLIQDPINISLSSSSGSLSRSTTSDPTSRNKRSTGDSSKRSTGISSISLGSMRSTGSISLGTTGRGRSTGGSSISIASDWSRSSTNK